MHLGCAFPPSNRFRMKTKGEIEAEISRAMVQFEIDYMGRGPKDASNICCDGHGSWSDSKES